LPQSVSYHLLSLFFFLLLPPPPRSTLFPYTTLFRSANATILDEVATQELYTADGFFGHAIEEYLIPFETTARLCNLELLAPVYTDRKSTRLNSSHVKISYAVFCLKKKKKYTTISQYI